MVGVLLFKMLFFEDSVVVEVVMMLVECCMVARVATSV